MSKPSQETLKRLNAFLDTLPTEAQNKCTLCTETLTHIVKTAEAQTGAPLATVTRELANRVNDGSAPSDKVSGEALRQRTLEMSGEKHRNCSNGTNKTDTNSENDKEAGITNEPESKECPICGSVYPGDNEHCPNKCEKGTAEKPEVLDARHFCFEAVGNLRSIPQNDPDKVTELIRVLDYIIEQIHDSGDNDALSQVANKLAPYNDHEKAPDLPNCSGRKLSTKERDEILFQVEKLYPERNDGWKRACALNEVGLKCGRKKDSVWTPKDVRDNLRHAKNRRDSKEKERNEK